MRPILLLMLLTWGWGWDPLKIGDYLRDGRAKIFLIGVTLTAAVHFSRTWHWSVGLMFGYLSFLFIMVGLPNYGLLESLMIPATLLIIPVLFKEISLETFENTVIFTGLLNAVFAYFNWLGHYSTPLTNLAYGELHPVIGLLGQHTLLSVFLVFALAITAYRAIEREIVESLGYAAASVFLLGAIVIANSSMGYLSLLAVLGTFSLVYAGAAWTTGLALIGGSLATPLLLLHPELLDLSGRWDIWKQAIAKIQERPWMGHGTGSWSAYARIIASERQQLPWTQLHSDWMQQVLEWGIVGMAPLIAKFHRMSRNFSNPEKLPYTAGLACFGVNALANFPMHITPHGQLAAISIYQLLRDE